MSANEVVVPDIGDFDDVPVIEILVSEGDSVTAEQPLVTLESDKATMDVPAPFDGVIAKLTVAVGDKVSEGTVIAHVEGAANGDGADSDSGGGLVFEGAQDADSSGDDSASAPAGGGTETVVEVPDIGDFTDVPVIELLVSAGDTVSEEQPLVTLESDKATMDVPAPVAGEVVSLAVAVGDKVSMGTAVAVIRGAGGSAPATTGPQTPAPETAPAPTPAPAPAADSAGWPAQRSHPGASAPDPRAPSGRPSPTAALASDVATGARFHATPAIRRFARELGVDLGAVKGTGRKGRILKEDVVGHVKGVMSGSTAPGAAAAAASGAGIPAIQLPDFSKFGKIETLELGRIKRLSGPHLQRAWLNIPHVTQHDEADITEMEAFRKSLKDEAAKRDLRITPLVFLMKALVAGMQKFPTFNSSLSEDGASLIIKHYYNVGIAVDTPNGLVVPVIRGVDSKGIMELSQDLADMSAKARDGKLGPADLSGGSMSISSLGGIGGTAFTPIVNAPEVAILGVARSAMKPVWNGKEFEPRLMLPLSLSYDHRVIDGAEGARFTSYIGQLLGDVRRLLL